MKWRQIGGKSPRIQNFLRHSVNSLPGVSFYIKEESTAQDSVGEKSAGREERIWQS